LDHPDYEQVSQYVTALLERNLPPQRVYHNLAHTRDEVLAAAERLAAMEGIDGEDLLLLRTAAWFHDAGFIVQGANHEAIGAQLAGQALPDFGYRPEQITAIQGMIMATRLPQSPRTPLEQIMADADLDLLGCDEFMDRNQDLRAEMATYGQTMNDEAWFSSQLDFLHNHTYFTTSANALRAEGKLRNARLLHEALAELGDSNIRTREDG
jgi:uncharacterized protein